MLKTTVKVGEILVKSGLISDEQLAKAIEVQRGTTKRLGEILVELGLITETDIAVALGKQLGIPFASSASGLLARKGEGLEDLVPEDFARQHLVLPLSRNLRSLTVACVDPLDLITMDNLNRLTDCDLNVVVTTRRELEQAIDILYGKDSMFREAIDQSYQLVEELPTLDDEGLSLDRLKQAAEEAPVIRLVDLIIRQAIRQRASDIHIEPWKDKISLRYRIDGVLYEIAPPAKNLHAAIISRIKILSKLDIAEKRLPQDGGFMMTLEDKEIDFRVSTIPTIYGEKVALRILKKMPELLDVAELGFSATELEHFRKSIQVPYGLILLTGPTGSGKTTTLYAAINEIKSPTKNILTIEDPVEYRLDGVNQVQTKPSIGLTFANALRAFLRQDPDVIMVGEIRDLETAESCIRAALTGHMILSTVHTNDAPSAVTRLIDIGVAPYLISTTISLVVAQRLLRQLCERCKEAYEPVQEIRSQFQIAEELLYRPKGCEQCANTGYHGRLGIFEVMTFGRELREAVAKGVPSHALKDAAIAQGMSTLWQQGLEKVRAGLTSLEELEGVVLER
ncbi:MAG: Flp pilus assembly complex ATPase component TadA [Candidatus Omnitrophica bacterium]|nr:Flp pilus assembly complex ATPase component TadA [Candidatus Omnitrophota bacterium]